MILTDSKLQTLKDYIQARQMSNQDFLEMAVSITDELAGIHLQNMVYQDITPFNIIIDSDSKKAFIKPSTISQQNEANLSQDRFDKIIGDLHYISPEQTRLLSLPIDYRSDLYSLGAIFYEMLTGKAPFCHDDLTALIHAHIAIKPITPTKINNQVSDILSNIVLKLLEKLPANRYQSVFGLLNDLNKCLSQLKQEGCLENFPIGEDDISVQFKIPEKLYGRTKELDILKNIMSRVKNGETDIVFISGGPGIGKSFIVQETRDYFVNEGGCFIEGKFDQYQRDIPYSGIIKAFQDLIRQLLTKTEDKLMVIKQTILDAVGLNGKILLDIIPELKLIIGKQKPVPDLNPDKAKNRHKRVLQNFIKAIASEEAPLIFFFDDLHWADTASIELIEMLVSEVQSSPLLIIATFRDIEASENFALKTMTVGIQDNNINAKTIRLKPLSGEFISAMIEDTLALDMACNSNFINLVLDKTSGNPMFVKEFLIDLHKHGFILFHQNGKQNRRSNHSASWQIDMAGISSTSLASNVMDIVSVRIEKLSRDTINVLKLASCIGVEFTIAILSKIHGKSEDELIGCLTEAISESIIIKKSDCFLFIHDKLQEMVYNLIAENEKQTIHYSIGQLLLKKETTTRTSEEIFNILHQLNLAMDLLNINERNILIDLNLQAGKKAKASTVYSAAAHFLKQGMQLLPGDSWQIDYQTTLAYYIELSEAEYLTGNYEEAERLFNISFDHAKLLSDRLKVYDLKMDCYIGQMRHNELFNTAKAVFKELGFTLPGKISKITVAKEKMKMMLRLHKRQATNLLNLPAITDAKMIHLIRMMIKVADAAYSTAPKLFAFLTIKGVNLSLRYGNCPGIAYFYSCLATLYCQPGIFNDIDKGYEFSKLAIELNKKHYSKNIHAKILLANSNVTHWKEPLIKNLNNYLQMIDFCLEDGDRQYLSFASLYNTINYLLMSRTLQETIDLFTKCSHHINQLNQPQLESYLCLVKQALDNNADKNQDRLLLASFHLSKSFQYYLYGDYEKGIELGKNENFFLDGLCSSPIVPIFYFFYALHLSANYHNVKQKRIRIKYYYKLRDIKNKFNKWGRHNQSSYLPMLSLITAEIARIKRDHEQAVNFYNEAINLAQENELTYCQAIAYECAAKFYLHREMITETSQYIIKAYNCYQFWGAKTKLKIMKKNYPEFIPVKKEINNKGMVSGNISNSKPVSSYTCSLTTLGFQSITEASSLFSFESDAKKILKKILTISTMNSGAERVVLLLERDELLNIEAESSIKNGNITVKLSSSEQKDSVPESVIRLVTRTRETVLISNVDKDKTFAGDSYISSKKPKSILCVPIIQQTKLLGMIYFENSQASHLFNSKQHDLLKTLVQQIATLLIDNFRAKNKKPANPKKTQTESISFLTRVLNKEYKLTSQEIKVVLLFRKGCGREEICKSLDISNNTLRTYLKAIYSKTINTENEIFEKVGRVDKLSRLILFLNKLESARKS